MVRLMHGLLRPEIRSGCRSSHNEFPQVPWVVDENRTEHDRKIEQIVESQEFPLLMSRFELADWFWRSPKIDCVDDKEHRQQNPNTCHPHGPAVFCHPPERHSFEVA